MNKLLPNEFDGKDCSTSGGGSVMEEHDEGEQEAKTLRRTLVCEELRDFRRLRDSMF